MQVSQIKELDTHAIVGGKTVEAFGMSDSAEFFTVLSDTLYRDKIRAVVREIICNAWDAHIAAGKTDTPIDIRLTESELVIKDFGFGIPHEKLRDIYCVYGSSTKVNDKGQTGGFGLGSKAPFAYSDHFSVANCHAGEKVVCALSRGGENTDGKPSLNVMVRALTEESGVAVTVPIESGDMSAFESNIERVVLEGGINAVLNGERLRAIDYADAEKRGFVVSEAYSLDESRIYLRYGAVIYPISTTDQKIRTLVDHAAKFFGRAFTVILLAKPDTVGVTPSRESLSYSDKTTATVIALLERFVRQMRAAAPQGLKVLARTYVNNRENVSSVIDSDISLRGLIRPGAAIEPAALVASALCDDHYGQISSAYIFEKAGFEIYDRVRRRVIVEAVKQFPKYAPVLKRVLKDGYKFPLHNREKVRLALRHDMRLHMRVAADFGIARSLYVAWKHRGVCEASIASAKLASFFHRKDGFHYQSCKVTKRLVVAPTVKALREHIEARISSMSYSTEFVIGVVDKKLTKARTASLADAAKKYEIEVETVEVEEVPRAQPVKNPNFITLESLQRGRNGIVTGRQNGKATAFYLRLSGDDTHVLINREILDSQDVIFKRYGSVAIALNYAEEQKLIRRGSKPLAPHVIADFEKSARTRSALFEFLRINADGHYRAYNPDLWIAHRLARVSWKVATCLFPTRVAIDDRAREFIQLMKLANKIADGTGQNSVYSASFNRVWQRASYEFPHVVGRGGLDLSFLKYLNGELYNENERVIIAMIKHARAVHSTSAVTDVAAPLSEAKEAA